MEVINDFGTNITLTGDISFQTLDSWASFIHKDRSEIKLGGNDMELYIEVDDLDAFNTMIEKENVALVHPLQTHDWGQRGLRMYDPDMHIIEVSEPLTQVVARLAKQGLDVASISKKTMLPPALIEEWLK